MCKHFRVACIELRSYGDPEGLAVTAAEQLTDEAAANRRFKRGMDPLAARFCGDNCPSQVIVPNSGHTEPDDELEFQSVSPQHAAEISFNDDATHVYEAHLPRQCKGPSVLRFDRPWHGHNFSDAAQFRVRVTVEFPPPGSSDDTQHSTVTIPFQLLECSVDVFYGGTRGGM